MKKILIFLVVVFIITIVAVTKFVFPSCENEILKNSESKDGKYIAILYSRSCGATTDDYTNIDIKRKSNFIRIKKNIFRLKGYNTKISMDWDNSTLNIGYRKGSELQKNISNWGDIKINYNEIISQE